MLQLAVFLALAFSIVIAIFAVQNTTPVGVSFLFFRAEAVAVSVLVLVSAALGAGVMLLLGAAREIGMRWRQRGLHQQLRAAEQRVQRLEAHTAAPAAEPTTMHVLREGATSETTAPLPETARRGEPSRGA